MVDPAPPPLPPPMPQKPPQTSGLAVASLVLSVPSLLLGFLSIPAVICGHLALAAIKRSQGRLGGRGLGIAGLVMGYVGMAVFVAGLTIFGTLVVTMMSDAVGKKSVGFSDEAYALAEVPLPVIPPLPPFQPLAATGVQIAEVNFGSVNKGLRVPPGARMKLHVYLPPGEHAPHSLPCVIVAPAGTNMIVGNDLDSLSALDGDPDFDETLPYALAGMVAIQYSLDGAHDEEAKGLTKGWTPAYRAFRAAGAGTVNGRNALEFALQRLPMVDPEKLFVAGHSSAGTVALLLAAHEPRLRGGLAYAPGVDVEEHLREIVNDSSVDLIFPELRAFLKAASPMNQTARMAPPIFLFQAKDDSKAPYATLERFAKKLRETNAQVTVETVESGDHYTPMIEQGIPGGIRWIRALIGGPERPSAPKAE